MASTLETKNRAKPDKSVGTLLAELRELVLAYAKQETLEPLRALGKYLGYGVGGAVLVGLGFVLLSLAGLRALQEETYPHWAGNWSWVPYALAFAWSVLVGLVLYRQIGAHKRREQRARRSEG